MLAKFMRSIVVSTSARCHNDWDSNCYCQYCEKEWKRNGELGSTVFPHIFLSLRTTYDAHLYDEFPITNLVGMHFAHAFFASRFVLAGTAAAVCPTANLVAHVTTILYVTLDSWVICLAHSAHHHRAHHAQSSHHHRVLVTNNRLLYHHLRLLLHHWLLYHGLLYHTRLLHHWLLHHWLLHHGLLHHGLLHHGLLHHGLLHLSLGCIIDGVALCNQGLWSICACHLARFYHVLVCSSNLFK